MPLQLTLNLEPGLGARYPSLKACVRSRIYADPRPAKTIAADMDLSESELTRKLSDNPNDTRNLNCDDLEAYIDKTGDTTPIYYLIDKYAIAEESKRAYAAADLARLLHQAHAIAATLGVELPAVQKTKRK